MSYTQKKTKNKSIMSKLTVGFVALQLFGLGYILQGYAEGPIIKFRHRGLVQLFVDKTKDMMISDSCRRRGDRFNCHAYNALKLASMDAVSHYIDSGVEPGAAICYYLLEANPVTGFDSDENEISFCEFEDGSLVDNATVFYYGFKNDALK